MRHAGKIQAAALVALFVALTVMGMRNLQLMRFHLFAALLVALIVAVLVVFAVSTRGAPPPGETRGRAGAGHGEGARGRGRE
ncbi:MAG: hypothetical protein HYV93_16280 [Candidatus Rokubacteria bacterium]|nr:hypothetical protein [Candidatus Rokubacteria bacterium]